MPKKSGSAWPKYKGTPGLGQLSRLGYPPMKLYKFTRSDQRATLHVYKPLPRPATVKEFIEGEEIWLNNTGCPCNICRRLFAD